jgi:hypothetical protein
MALPVRKLALIARDSTPNSGDAIAGFIEQAWRHFPLFAFWQLCYSPPPKSRRYARRFPTKWNHATPSRRDKGCW